MADAESSAVSGGLLVVLGIIVAVAIGYFVMFNQPSSGPDIQVNIPNPSAPSIP